MSGLSGANHLANAVALDTGWGTRIDLVRAVDEKEAARVAADEIVDAISVAVAQRGSASLVLAGGSTPLRLYRLLADGRYREKIEWQRVDLFFGDERCVHKSHRESNYSQIRDALFSPGGAEPRRIFRMPTELSARDCARAYEATIKDYFSGSPARFDCVLLGLGGDGHTASLFPGGEGEWAATGTGGGWVVNTHSPVAPLDRVSMTPHLLNQGRKVLFLVTGETKSEIVRRVLSADRPERYPACRVDPIEAPACWILDPAAAQAVW